MNVNLACFRISVSLRLTRWWRDGLTNSKSCQRTHVPTHTGTDTVYTHTRTGIHVSKGYTVYCCVTKLHRMSHQLWSEHMEQLSHPHSSHMCIHRAHTHTQHTWCNLHKFPFPHFLHYKKKPIKRVPLMMSHIHIYTKTSHPSFLKSFLDVMVASWELWMCEMTWPVLVTLTHTPSVNTLSHTLHQSLTDISSIIQQRVLSSATLARITIARTFPASHGTHAKKRYDIKQYTIVALE